jgi:FlaA1/EpsC-like NDP-sugar epimerase
MMLGWVNRLTLRRRMVIFFVGDAVLLVLSLLTAVVLRFDGVISPAVAAQLPTVVAISLVAKIAAFATQGLYSLSWSQVGLEDMIAIFRGVTLGSGLFWVAVFALKGTPVLEGFPRSVLLVDYVITLYAIGAFRIGRRVYQHVKHTAPAGGRPALIVGAGAAGEQLARSLRHTPASGYAPVGFIDDDTSKLGTVIHGLRVLGSRDQLDRIIREYHIETVLIAIPSGTSRVIRSVIAVSREAGVREIRIVPGLERILDGQISFTDLREVQLADLLGREMVQVDTVAVEQWFRGRTVLVTGAGGSIGSELCRQIVRFGPEKLVLLDSDETGLFWVEQEMQRLHQRVLTLLVDIRDAGAVREAFQRAKPQVVFHAAAYKHVGLMERHPEMAVATNILGTHVLAAAAAEARVEKFVLISTDKAVNPSSVMGVTKRVAEQVCLARNGRGTTQYLAVRFGNVLGSRGSVVPLFQEKIRRGEALTIRGPNMRRYFMAVSEAVLLVLQAGVTGRGGEIFVLDMGEPVHIVGLARELIRLSGLEPDTDVPIVFADPEPGEKEHEDLLAAEEGTVATQHERIFVARVTSTIPAEDLFARIAALERMVKTHDLSGIVGALRTLVPTYQPSELLQSQIALMSPR